MSDNQVAKMLRRVAQDATNWADSYDVATHRQHRWLIAFADAMRSGADEIDRLENVVSRADDDNLL